MKKIISEQILTKFHRTEWIVISVFSFIFGIAYSCASNLYYTDNISIKLGEILVPMLLMFIIMVFFLIAIYKSSDYNFNKTQKNHSQKRISQKKIFWPIMCGGGISSIYFAIVVVFSWCRK